MTDTQIRPLPRPLNAEGAQRRVGIEVEFAGLDEAGAARLCAEELGGSAHEAAPYSWAVTGSALGDIKVVLDTKYRKQAESGLVQAGLHLAHGLIPVEIVTDPVLPQDIPRLDALLHRFAAEGATGTEKTALQGFGTHLNVEIAGETVDDIRPVLTAYALAEAGIRTARPIDATRALLPFVAPYPAALLDWLAAPEAAEWSLDDLAHAYLDEAPSRNHALDMLPILAHLAPDLTAKALGNDGAVSARPAYHFRLPDSRLGDANWSLAQEWNRWVQIEELATDPARMQALREGWRAHRGKLVKKRDDWAGEARAIWAGEMEAAQ